MSPIAPRGAVLGVATPSLPDEDATRSAPRRLIGMASKAIEETFAWLRAAGIMVPARTVADEFTFEERDAMSRAYSAGNYANAYETTDLETALTEADDMPYCERYAFTLGFFSSYSLDEIGSEREAFDEAYFSPAGRYIVHVAKYADDRFDEYADDDEYADEAEVTP